MEHHFHNLYDSFSRNDKTIWAVSSFLGWFSGIQFFNWVHWGPVLSGLMSVAIGAITTLVGAVALDFYKLKIKPKLFKTKDNAKEKNIDNAA